MNWSDKKPTRPGWYWIWTNASLSIVQIGYSKPVYDNLRVFGFGQTSYPYGVTLDGFLPGVRVLFNGPIIEPMHP